MLPVDEWFRVHHPQLAEDIVGHVAEYAEDWEERDDLARLIKISVREAMLKNAPQELYKKIEDSNRYLEWCMTLLTPNRDKLLMFNQSVLDDINNRYGFTYEKDENEKSTNS